MAETLEDLIKFAQRELSTMRDVQRLWGKHSILEKKAQIYEDFLESHGVEKEEVDSGKGG